jgi:hypothetical protein
MREFENMGDFAVSSRHGEARNAPWRTGAAYAAHISWIASAFVAEGTSAEQARAEALPACRAAAVQPCLR